MGKRGEESGRSDLDGVALLGSAVKGLDVREEGGDAFLQAGTKICLDEGAEIIPCSWVSENLRSFHKSSYR